MLVAFGADLHRELDRHIAAAFAEVHVGTAVDKPLHKRRIALTEIIVTQQ